MPPSPESTPISIHRAKLRRPRPVTGVVSRPRLAACLDRGLQAPLTLLSAPAGFGKTTLLTTWSAPLSMASAWLTSDPSDRHLPRFVAHMTAAIESTDSELVVGKTVLAGIQRQRPPPAAAIGEALADALHDLHHDALLIVDDYHQAASVEVEDFVAALLQFMPPSFHLVLATRIDPALPLARLRLLGQVVEVRGTDLQFTGDEVSTLLAAAGIAPDATLATAVRETTGGWAAGVRLAALALPASNDANRITDIVTSDRRLMDFLVEEVLSTRPVDVQNVLLRTAIVDRVSASLVDALLDQPPQAGTQALLEMLAREGVFIEPEGNDGVWFRPLPLFRGLLLHLLGSRLSDDGRAALHARAGAWFAAQGLITDAVHQYLAAGDGLAAASTVEQNARRVLASEDWPLLAAWLALLPAEHIAARPHLLLAKAYVAHLAGRFASVRDIVADIRLLLHRDQEEASLHAGLFAECDALELSQTLLIDQTPWAASVARDAVEHIPANFRVARGIAYIACGLALQTAGRTEEAVDWLSTIADREAEHIDAGSIRALMGLMFVQRQAGHYDECQQISRHLLEMAQRHTLPVSVGWAHWALGWIAYEHNDLEAAIAHFEAIAVDRKRLHLACVGEGMFGLALAYQASGMSLEALVAVRQFTEIVHELHALAYLPSIRLFEARLALARGGACLTMESISASDGALAANSLVTFEHEGMSRIKVLIAHGTPATLATAQGELERLLAAAQAGHHRARMVEILALAALASEACGQSESALAALKHSLDLGAPAGFCRTYVDLGQAIVPLLERLGTEAPYADDIRRLLTAINAGPLIDRRDEPEATVASALLQALTPRESDVLDGLCRRLSYQEIAGELYISVHTVKSHAHHIYEKLSVANRRQAMHKAESLGLAPRDALSSNFT